MNTKHIIFVPGKNPAPEEAQYSQLLWRSLLEGVRRANREVADTLQVRYEHFHLIDWNGLYYQSRQDVSSDMPWIDALLNKLGPTEQDIRDARSWNVWLSRVLLTMGDDIPFLIRLLPTEVRCTADEISRYFNNTDNVAREVRGLLKEALCPLLEHHEAVLLIGHSFGSAIAYDTLWELSHQDGVKGKVDFLTLGSPLGLHYIQRRLLGMKGRKERKYPDQIRYWVNFSAEGDLVALNRRFNKTFRQMLELGLVESIEDHYQGIYNIFRSDQGLDCHRAYGYMVSPAVGNVIADWWKHR